MISTKIEKNDSMQNLEMVLRMTVWMIATVND